MIDEAIADPDQAERAESVRAYLVALRGGAPFLSSADARLLLGWLDQGVPVALILGALDQVAEQRRQRRSRGRMSLNSARKAVEKRWGGLVSAPPPPPGQVATAALVAWVEELERGHGADPRVAALVADARVALGRAEGAHALIEQLAGCCRRFHDALWEHDPDEQAALRQAAADELAPLQESLGAAVFADLVEDAARSRLRARWPRVCASELWDRLPSTGELAGR